MKKIVLIFTLFCFVLCSGCGNSILEDKSKVSFYELYPNLRESESSRESRLELKEKIYSLISGSFSDKDCTININDNYVYVNISFSDVKLRSAPDEWDTYTTEAIHTADQWQNDLNGRRSIFQLSDASRVLLTVINGEISFDRFEEEDKAELEEENNPELESVVTHAPDENTNNFEKDRRNNWSDGDYLGSLESDKYHNFECRAAKKILPENEIWFSSEESAKAAGYSRCGICW